MPLQPPFGTESTLEPVCNVAARHNLASSRKSRGLLGSALRRRRTDYLDQCAYRMSCFPSHVRRLYFCKQSISMRASMLCCMDARHLLSSKSWESWVLADEETGDPEKIRAALQEAKDAGADAAACL